METLSLRVGALFLKFPGVPGLLYLSVLGPPGTKMLLQVSTVCVRPICTNNFAVLSSLGALTHMHVHVPSALKVSLPVYLPNAASLSRDRRKGNARTLKVWIEFQILIIEDSNSVLSIRQDALKAHGLNFDIDRWKCIFEINNVTNLFELPSLRFGLRLL